MLHDRPTPPFPLPAPADPVTCTHCEQVVCDARAADSIALLLAHDCPQGRAPGGPWTVGELLADLYPPR
ncbi:MAG TPA: hypothetical protein VGQ26_06320 [Streptosporangiaceae bacterium]|nr:hypothetical protein [Streptosporangiaceae bacterium]